MITEYDNKENFFIAFLKKEILLNKDYSRYLELEKKLFFDIKDINNKLNCLLEKSGCI